MLDTHHQDAHAQRATGYGEPVTATAEPTTTANTAAALDAIAEMADLETKIDAARVRRDKAVVRMHRKDKMRAPLIARLTGMSVSNVRRAIDLAARR